MKTCKNCGEKNDFMALRCTCCGNDTFVTSVESGYCNEGGDKKNLIIGVLAGVLVTVVAVFCLFSFNNNDDDDKPSDNHKRYGYDYSYDEEEAQEHDKDEAEEEAQEQEIAYEPETEENEVEVDIKETEKDNGSEEEPVFMSEVEDEPTQEPPTMKLTTETTTQKIEETKAVTEGVVEINDSLQYNLNVFMSNFSEARMESFSGRPSDDQLVDFAENYNLVNKISRYENGSWTVNGNECNKRISENYIYDTLDSHFSCDINRTEGKQTIDYSDGYFYILFTGGMVQNDLSIVNYLEYKGDNVYYVRFNLYFTGGSNSGHYRKNDTQMSAESNASGSGEAYIIASDINNYNTYRLESYNVSR